jgi:hypothetical protein
MCPFLKGFRFHQNAFLQLLQNNVNQTCPISLPLKQELTIWAKCVLAGKSGLPIPLKREHPPIKPMQFISYAAGAALSWKHGRPENVSKPNDRGVASLGFQNQNYFFAAILRWPVKFLNTYASNSTLLEIIGLLLPFLCKPNLLVGKHIQLHVDNEALLYTWNKRLCKQSELVSILLQVLHLCEYVLPCRIYLNHVPRCSNPTASMVDRLSRSSTTTEADLSLLKHLELCRPTGPLLQWLQKPTPDWDLPSSIITHLKKLL